MQGKKRGKRRLIAALLIAALCAPGTWLRSDINWDPPAEITREQVRGPGATDNPAWELAGVWEYRGERSLLFGGFSALMVDDNGDLIAFSDRGGRFAISAPDQAGGRRAVTRQGLNAGLFLDHVDIEAATRDPATGDYWIALENAHIVNRYRADHSSTGVRALDADKLDWTYNTGAEAMERLADGRFLIVPEGRRTAVLFEGDPVEGADYATFSYKPPVPGHAATDLAQLPDGRMLLLLRNLDWPTNGMPPFESKIAIGPAPANPQKSAWAPTITLDLAGVLPRENYEGMAVRERDDGRIDVWLIADDNMSVFQRNLVAKLILDPAKLSD